MKMEVRALDRAKRGTWGAQPIFEELGGVVPRSLVNTVLDERRKSEGRVKRPQSKRYEFTGPGLTYSTDFMKVRPYGRVLRELDDYSRFTLGFAHERHWQEERVAEFTVSVLDKHGDPYFFKHDLEFRGEVFHSMLRSRKIIAIPNPEYYAPFNGKNERDNKSKREWIAPTESDRPSVRKVWEELVQGTLDQNDVRRKGILGRKPPAVIWETEPHVQLKRNMLYSEWDGLREQILARLNPPSHRKRLAEMEAMRLASMIIVKRHKLVRYLKPEAPKV
jgi:hypothetical protein